MKTIWIYFGSAIFWTLWPFWFFYFKKFPVRTRILVMCGDKVLLVKNWPGSPKWSLPGGGVDHGENLLTCAVRELQEEVGIDAAETALKDIGEYLHRDHGLRFKAHYFSLELAETIAVRKRWPEIIDAQWYKLSEIRSYMLSKDAAYALKQYIPPDQTALL